MLETKRSLRPERAILIKGSIQAEPAMQPGGIISAS